ncbi:MAG TPA: metallophosphoesterase [Acidimicrobiia bacterium]|nr:metallophosphoesterase [Acidimicrobiia bacterium]
MNFGRVRALMRTGAVLLAVFSLNLAPQAPAATATAPAPASFSFAGGGDMGYSPEAAAVVKGIASAGVDFSLHFGDMAYDQIYPESAWCDFIKDPQNGVGPDFPYEIVAGGHDLGTGPGPAAQYRTLIDKYTACVPDHMNSTGTYGKQYYFDHPAGAPLLRVIMISPSITMPDGTTYDYSPGTPDWQWLSDAIDGARTAGIRWVAVGMARDCISAGEKSCEIGPDLFNLLVDKRVDLILEGHEHGYERSRQLATGPNCPAVPVDAVNPACFADDGSGSTYTKGRGPIVVVAGTLGIPLRPMNPADSEAPDFVTLMGSNINYAHGFMKYTVTADRIQAQFVRTSKGTFADQFQIVDPDPATFTPPVTVPSPVSGAGPPTPQPAMVDGAAARSGYWMLGGDGAVYPFGDARAYGTPSLPAGHQAVDLEPTPSGNGYWVLDDTGAVTPFGDAPGFGGVPAVVLQRGELPTSLSATPTGQGYWVFTNRGRAVSFGDARFLGDVSDRPLNGPVLDSVATPSGNGYYMVASDGGIFAFGDAAFDGSMGGRALNAPVRSLVPDADGKGYWLVAADGGIFAFDAPFRGSMGGVRLARPVTGMVRYGDGYLMVATDGGVFDFSDLPFAGSLGGHPPTRPVTALAALPS